jgi:hypothetical protein
MARQYLTRRQVAERYSLSVRSIERRQHHDPDFPGSLIMHGRHYFDLDKLEAYDIHCAANPQRRGRPAYISARPAASADAA